MPNVVKSEESSCRTVSCRDLLFEIKKEVNLMLSNFVTIKTNKFNIERDVAQLTDSESKDVELNFRLSIPENMKNDFSELIFFDIGKEIISNLRGANGRCCFSFLWKMWEQFPDKMMNTALCPGRTFNEKADLFSESIEHACLYHEERKKVHHVFDYIIASPEICRILEFSRKFKKNEKSDSRWFLFEKIGTLNNIAVWSSFALPSPSKEVILGNKRGFEFSLNSLCIDNRERIFDLVPEKETKINRKVIAARYSKKMIDKNCYGKVTVENYLDQGD